MAYRAGAEIRTVHGPDVTPYVHTKVKPMKRDFEMSNNDISKAMFYNHIKSLHEVGTEIKTKDFLYNNYPLTNILSMHWQFNNS